MAPTAPIQAATAHLLLVHLIAALTVWRSPGRDEFRPELVGAGRYLVAPLALWDSAWYERIASAGYAGRQESAAFWPLYPWLVGAVSSLSGISHAATGVLISHGAFIAALIVFHGLIARGHGEEIAGRTVWLLALSPVAFFLSAFYSESLFLLLSVSAIAFARNGRWTGAALALFAASLTRSCGGLLVIPLGLILIRQAGLARDRRAGHLVQLAAAAAGPLVFAVHLNRVWGKPLLMVTAQEHWNRVFSLPWETLWNGFRRTELIYVTGRHTCLDAARDRQWAPCRDALGLNLDSLSDDLATASVLLALLLVPVVIGRLPLAEALYTLALIAFPLFSTTIDSPLLSTPRYLLMAFPLFVALAMLLRARAVFMAAIAIEATALAFLLSVFARAYFVS
ncbi:MAG: hypothetical protein IT336_02390 [Thermomicrobiales bacterium]|nr:hypothetical protein [Thermomicrobiales bacterium]